MPYKPVLVISIDTELGWGFILNPENEILDLLRRDPGRGRTGTRLLLEMFEKYGVPATWATVGHLFLGESDREQLVHRELPQFEEGVIDWDYYGGLRDDVLFRGEDVVESIMACPAEQELGLHSFFHVLFPGCSRRVAESEIDLGIKAANRFGIDFKSFVFPDNQIAHLDVLRNSGFRIYRSEPRGYFIRMARRAMSEFLPSPVSPRNRDGIWEIAGSVEFGYPLLPVSELPGARFGLRRAIWAHRVFHVHLHPWNLLLNQTVAGDLDAFLALAAQRRDEGGLEIMTMGELADRLDSGPPAEEGRQPGS